MSGSSNRQPIAAATGRGLKIAVIDSGVNVRHPHICAPTHCIVIDLEGEDLSADDPVGHGTAVTAAIQEKAPNAEYYALKLFGASLRATSDRLIAAIEWAIVNRMDIVNLSLGTPNFDRRSELQSLVERAGSAGTLLISARSAGPQPVLPGVLKGVIGVEVDWDLPRDRYRVSDADGSPYFLASGYPRPLPGIPPARNLNGISFAVANMTGFVARACETLDSRSFCEICEVLAAEASTLAT
jgi:subtilisin family serine protease